MIVLRELFVKKEHSSRYHNIGIHQYEKALTKNIASISFRIGWPIHVLYSCVRKDWSKVISMITMFMGSPG